MAESRPFRYERKFLVEVLDPYEVESIVRLHPALFFEVYAARRVNNIYLDSLNARNYADNVDGVADRVKYRIRWYGDLFGSIDKPVLEVKRKRGLLGSKEVYPLPPFALGQESDLRLLEMDLQRAELPPRVLEDVKALRPSLLNRYRRQYYLSADQRVRLTLDTQREFYEVGPRKNTFCFRLCDTSSSIVELKHAPEWTDRAAEIASRFPFRLTKSSKYVQGLDLLGAY